MSQTEPEPELPRTPTIDARGAPAELTTAAAIAVAPALDAAVAPFAPRDRAWFGLPRTYWVLWSGMLINRLGGSVFFLLSIYLTRERHLSTEMAGLVMCLYAAGGVFAGPLGGVLADHFGRRPTLLLGTACAGTLMLALGGARSSAAIVALAPLLGFFTDICRPPLQAAVADVVPPDRRVRAFGLLYWALNLGFGGASALGGTLAEHSFGLLFVIDALTTFAYGVIVFVGVRETRHAGAPPSAQPNMQQRPLASASLAWLEPFRDRRFRRFFAITLLMLIAFVQVIVALPLDMRAHGLGTRQLGFLLGLNGLFIVIAQPIALRLFGRFSQQRWLVIGAALCGLGLGANGLAGGSPVTVYVVATALWTLGEIGFSTASPTLVASMSPVDRRGVYQGGFQLAWALATMIAPVIGTATLARFGGPTLWLGCLAACWLAALLYLRGAAGRG
jgi:MFS family permease